MIDSDSSLSDAGCRRRDQILQLAMHTARQRRQQRRAVRTVRLFAMLGLILAGATLLYPRFHSHPAPVFVRNEPLRGGVEPLNVVIVRIETDPTLSARLTIVPRPATWTRIGDQELLQALADARQPAGLVRIDGRDVLLFR